MSKRAKRPSSFWLLVPVYIGLAVVFAVLIKRGHMQLLEPAGVIAELQSRLLWGVIVFAGIVGILMISTFFWVALRYKEGKRARYAPDWTAGKFLQFFGWGVPIAAMSALSVLVWITAHQVDPYRSLNSKSAPITIQVVALRWKWLFLYPDNRIATVNTLDIPVNVPVTFELTADAPMNSFWIPRLSGQMYAMTGMITQLHIEASKVGIYTGSPAEISGDEFAGMDFAVHVVSPQDYATWLASSIKAKQPLGYTEYTELAKPSGYVKPATYSLSDPNLFQIIVMQFMSHTDSSEASAASL